MQEGDTKAAPAVKEVVILNTSTVEVRWQDHSPSRFHTFWMRYHCHCPLCKEPLSGMRHTHVCDVPKKLTLKTATSEEGFLVVTCEEEKHSIRLPFGWLKEFSYSPEDMRARSSQRDVIHLKGEIKSFDFGEVCRSEDTYFRWLQAMDEQGLALLKNVPCENGKVCEVGELVAPVFETLYGRIFTVEAKDKVTNIAYLEVPLEYHQDLPYYESPPGLQFLHCIRLDPCVEGGANVFVDVIDVAEQLQREFPEYFETLIRVPATFQKIHEEKTGVSHYVMKRPHITVNLEKKVTGVFWNPQAEGPLQVSEDLVLPYYEAYFKFAELITRSEARGIFINIDDFKNAIQVQYLKRSPGRMVKRMGNQCYS